MIITTIIIIIIIITEAAAAASSSQQQPAAKTKTVSLLGNQSLYKYAHNNMPHWWEADMLTARPPELPHATPMSLSCTSTDIRTSSSRTLGSMLTRWAPPARFASSSASNTSSASSASSAAANSGCLLQDLLAPELHPGHRNVLLPCFPLPQVEAFARAPEALFGVYPHNMQISEAKQLKRLPAQFPSSS